MKLIVGLGNPGSSYLMTRHNIGFMILDSIAENSFKKKQKSLIQKIVLKEQSVLLVKPQTYMNLSGEAVRDLITFYKIPLKNLLVIQDDVDQTFLSLKFQKNRGHGGHRGIENIHSHLKTPDYVRLKLGVGRPKSHNLSLQNNKETPQQNFKMEESETDSKHVIQSTSDYVLSPFTEKEQSLLKSFLKTGVEAVLYFIEEGFEKAAEKFNGKSI